MTSIDRIPRWLENLADTLDQAAQLSDRGEDTYRKDPALPLAFEALSNRIGDLVKRLIAADPQRFSDPIWRQAARHRDYVVHHYDRLDEDLLWRTVTQSFPQLALVVAQLRTRRETS